MWLAVTSDWLNGISMPFSQKISNMRQRSRACISRQRGSAALRKIAIRIELASSPQYRLSGSGKFCTSPALANALCSSSVTFARFLPQAASIGSSTPATVGTSPVQESRIDQLRVLDGQFLSCSTSIAVERKPILYTQL